MSTAEKIIDVLAEVAETDEVRRNPDLRLYDLHILDSLSTVQLILSFGDAFGVDISPAELDRDEWATPARIVSFMESRIGR